MKKIISLLSAAVISVSVSLFNAAAESSENTATAEIGGVKFTYSVTDDTACLLKVSASGSRLDIPEEIDGHAVTSVGEKAFFGNTTLSAVNIPDTVISLGANAFAGCLSLKEITIPDSVTELGNGCFMSCTSLQRVFIGSSLTVIPESCFYSCTALSSAVLSENTAAIGTQAFYGCTAMSSIYLPASVSSIGEDSLGRRYNIRSGSTENISGFSIIYSEGSAAADYAEIYSLSAAPASEGEYDVNMDGKITAVDASLVLNEYSELSSGSISSFCAIQKKAADINGDEFIDARDASLILSRYAELQAQN